MSDKDKRSAFTTVVISDIENNTQEVVYNSFTLPLLMYNGHDMTKNIEKIEAVPNEGIMIQNDIIFYDNTYASANDTFGNVLITMHEVEGTSTHSLAELIEDGFTITPFIDDGGGQPTLTKINVSNKSGNTIKVYGIGSDLLPHTWDSLATNHEITSGFASPNLNNTVPIVVTLPSSGSVTNLTASFADGLLTCLYSKDNDKMAVMIDTDNHTGDTINLTIKQKSE